MQTSEAYFAELAACLGRMPAAEREETLTYYREYAQEGGLLDGEQLRAHFGPPDALAAQILEDAAGKRPGTPPPSAPASHEPAQLPPLAVVLGILLVVGALAAVLLLGLRGPGNGSAQPTDLTVAADNVPDRMDTHTLE